MEKIYKGKTLMLGLDKNGAHFAFDYGEGFYWLLHLKKEYWPKIFSELKEMVEVVEEQIAQDALNMEISKGHHKDTN